MSTKVFVGNLSYRTTAEQLQAALSQAGEVRNVFVGTDRETGRSRGFAFVEFGSDEAAADAIKRFDGFEIDGRKVRVNAADERPRRPGPGGGGPPPYAGRPSYSAPAPNIGGGFSDSSSEDFFGGARSFKNKGSRRNVRARKRSLNF
ncbi:MAG: RNA-binding protein [Deltaproteobacteria bacterium]|nr:RNA-binding protein [Deltaproteobacteria bacterium]